MKKKNINNILLVIVIVILFSLTGYLMVKNSKNELSKNIASSEVNVGDGKCYSDCHWYCGTTIVNGPSTRCGQIWGTNTEIKPTYNCNTVTDCSDGGGSSGGGGPSATAEPKKVDCASGYEHTAGHVYDDNDCKPKKITGVTSSTSRKYFTPKEASGEFSTIDITPSDAPASLSLDGSGFSLSGKKLYFSNPAKGSGSTCKINSVTVKAENTRPSSKKSGTISACVYCSDDWNESSGYWKESGRVSFSNHYSTEGCNFYSEYESDIYGNKYYKKWYGRCCGVSAPKQDYGYCYGDQPYIGIATSVQWKLGPPSAGGAYPYIYKDITDESKCTTMSNANACKSSRVNTGKKEDKATSCEGTVSFSTNNFSTSCADGGSSFYNIACTTQVSTTFDADDNLVNSGYSLYQGQGFKFNVGVSETITCNATFNPTLWSNAYEKIMNKMEKVVSRKGGSDTAYRAYKENNYIKYENFIKQLQKEDGEDWYKAHKATYAEIYELYTIARSIEEIVNEYNAFKVPEDTAATATLNMSYSSNKSKSNTTYNYTLVSDKEECTPVKKVSETHNSITSNGKRGASWLEAPSNYTQIYHKIVNLYPQNASINKKNGEAIYDNTNTSITVLDGGNKIYLGNGTNAQDIPISITVSGLARNGSTVTNDKCSIKVTDRSMLYRPIELKNPFINTSWQKGENWINSLYDFTGTIHANTWSQKSMSNIDF